ncbi:MULTISPECIES: hypothetical protein [unclassified Bradyrhizobium]|uniref:hypothetical protein n=1 Tax=unclassified Bradyrhizobium TaxID=2631580 RepID=UPI001FF88950|nr:MULTISPECIES: hypothetical protein [unclassified Bradyrhizobium]
MSIAARREENERLKARFYQYHLPLEDVEIAQCILHAAQERAAAVIQGRIAERARSRFASQSRLLACPFLTGGTDHRTASTLRPCGFGAMTKIGEDVSKRST